MFIALAVPVYQNAGVEAVLSFHSRGITKTASESINIARLAARFIPCHQPGTRHGLPIRRPLQTRRHSRAAAVPCRV